ncbi:choice-of-anchor P family protein [Streptomyces mayteni]
MMRISLGRSWGYATTAVAALLLAAWSTTTTAAAGPADGIVPGASSALGLSSSLGGVDVEEARASYPEGPLRDAVEAVDVGAADTESVDGASTASGTALGAEASVTGNDTTGAAAAQGGVAELALDLGPDVGTLTTGAVRADCSAAPDAEPAGTVSLTDASLSLPGRGTLTFDEAPTANTTVRLPDGLGQVVLNEQRAAEDGSLTVNALRVELTDDGDLTLGSASCRGGGPVDERPADEQIADEPPAEETEESEKTGGAASERG